MTPSLLDCLLGDDADSPAERRRNIRKGLERDLERLLNTRRPFYADWARQLPDSIAAFGMKDFTTEDFNAEETRQALSDRIKACLKAFEPRLTKVDVDFDANTSVVSGIRFVISATLMDGPDTEPIEIGANFQRFDHSIHVDQSR